MPAKFRSEVRYRLKRPPKDEPPNPSNDALAWLVSRNPAWTRGPGQHPNIERIAESAQVNPATLLKVVKGDLDLSQWLMASLVKASIATGAARSTAERALFEIVGTGYGAVASGEVLTCYGAFPDGEVLTAAGVAA
jgi:hypothetical protein